MLFFAAGMASLVEMKDMTQLGTQSTYLQDSEDCSDVHALRTIMHMSGLQQIPTPPLSPESSPSSTLPYSVEANLEDQHAEALLDHMLQCEQIPTFEDADTYTDSQSSYNSQSSFTSSPCPPGILICTDAGAALLIQDCMWNSHTYEPRNPIGNGVYTPAPSPPPPATDNVVEEEVEVTTEEAPVEIKEVAAQPSDAQEECISPCDIFPTYTLVAEKEGVKVASKPRSHTTEQSDWTRHPQAMSSESGEWGVAIASGR